MRSPAQRTDDEFGALLEAAPDAMVIANQEGEIVLVNSQTEKMFGFAREELLGRPIGILIPKRFHDNISGHNDGYCSGSQAEPAGDGIELYGMRKDGAEFPVEIRLSPLRTGSGLLVTRAIRDITGPKRIERILQEKNAELERIGKAKDSFLASMSHELRTPLNSIIGFAEFLVDGKPGAINARQEEYLGDIVKSGRHLLHLINDILDLVQIYSAEMELNLQAFEPANLIHEVCADFHPIAQSKRIAVRVAAGSGLDAVTGDVKRFKQILSNLLSNALKFTGDGGNVEITAERDGAESFRVSIRDNGIGIAAADIGRLFTDYDQLETRRARRIGGTGLGLVLTRTIVEMMAGTIHAESKVGKGSTFTVILPLVIKGGR